MDDWSWSACCTDDDVLDYVLSNPVTRYLVHASREKRNAIRTLRRMKDITSRDSQ